MSIKKISLDDFLDSDPAKAQEFISALESVKKGYGETVKGISKDIKDLQKSSESFVKVLKDQEKALTGVTAVTKEGRDQIAKSSDIINNASKSVNLLKERERELAAEKAKTIKLTKQLADATDKLTKSNTVAAGSIDDLKNKVKEAEKAYKALGDNVDPFIKSRALENYQKYQAQLSEANAALKVTKKDAEFAVGSYQALDKEVKDLERDYKKLPDVLGKNKKAAQELAKTLEAKRQVLKNLDAGIGNYQRNVGNYALALQDAALGSTAFGGQLSSLAQRLVAGKEAVGGVVKGLGLLKTALITTGIGALIVTLGAVAAAFKTSDAAGELLERKLSGISEGADYLKGRLASLGETIIDKYTAAVNNSAKANGTLATILNINSKIFQVAAQVLFPGATQALNAINKATATTQQEFKDVAAAAERLTGILQGLDDEERIFGVTSLKNKGIIDQLIKSSKDLELTRKQRLANLDEAGRIELADTQQALVLAKKRFDVIVEQNQLKTKGNKTGRELSKAEVAELTSNLDAYEKYSDRRGRLSDDLLNKQAEAQKKIIELENETLLKQQAIQNRRSLLEQQIAQEEFDINKKKNDKIIKQAEGLDKLQEKKLKDFSDTVFKNTVDTQAKITQAEIKGAIDRIEAVRKEEEQKQLIKERAAELRQQLEETLTNGLIELGNLPFDRARQRREQEANELEAQRDFELSLAGDNKEEQARINKEFDRKQRDLRKKQAQDDKKQALFNIALNTAIALIKQLSVTPLPLGAPLAALIVATGAVQAAVVAAKPIPAFEKGTGDAPEGWAIVDEKGPEMIERNGKRFLGKDRGPRMQYLKKGDKVYTAKETADLMGIKNSYNSYIDGASRIGDSKPSGPAINYDNITQPIVSAIESKKSLNLNFNRKGISAIIEDKRNKIELISRDFNISL